MSWQDIVFLAGNLVFFVALVPVMRMMHSGVPLRTSMTTALVLVTYTVAFATLGLWLEAAGSALVASSWGVVAYRRCWSLWWTWDSRLIARAHVWLMDRRDRQAAERAAKRGEA